MEKHRRDRADLTGIAGLNPYAIYLGGAALALVTVLLLFGLDGLLAYLLLCAHAQLQLLLSDYVQHYGLLRQELPTGALEPAGPQHSWDAPHVFSGMMMLNAPRHADHHAHPARPYPELGLNPVTETPRLPHSLPVMATIALIPRLWHRIMDRRLAALRRRPGA
jgi:alkane 1-monooxygenase